MFPVIPLTHGPSGVPSDFLVWFRTRSRNALCIRSGTLANMTFLTVESEWRTEQNREEFQQPDSIRAALHRTCQIARPRDLYLSDFIRQGFSRAWTRWEKPTLSRMNTDGETIQDSTNALLLYAVNTLDAASGTYKSTLYVHILDPMISLARLERVF